MLAGPETPIATTSRGLPVSLNRVATAFPDMVRVDVELRSGPLDVETISDTGTRARDHYEVRADCRVDHTVRSIVATPQADELFVDSDAVFYRVEWSTGQVHRWWRSGLAHGMPRGYQHPRVRIIGMFLDGTEMVIYDELPSPPPLPTARHDGWAEWAALIELIAAALLARRTAGAV